MGESLKFVRVHRRESGSGNRLALSAVIFKIVLRRREDGYEYMNQSQGFFRGSCDPLRFSGSKKHQKLFLSEKSFPRVFRHGVDGYEYG